MERDKMTVLIELSWVHSTQSTDCSKEKNLSAKTLQIDIKSIKVYELEAP